LRSVVPGFIGARSVKWLGKIVVSDRPSPNHYLADAYKLVNEGQADEWAGAPPIYNFPINSVTCLPAAGAEVPRGSLSVQGYALPPGEPGRTIARVEVSADGGRRWSSARFTTPAREFCWRLWQADITILPETTELLVRATDSAGHMQPQSVAWNLKGYLFNAFHRTPIRVRSS
jgi:sulfite oxidase